MTSGAESVDGFVLDKGSLEISARRVGNQVKCVVFTGNGADWADAPEKMQCISCISDEETIEILRVAKYVEKSLDCPPDMEWTVD